ncbi:MAG: hypothetical protein OEY36_01195 [Gammaproteobacteria bacterium]|nr:hypothetical protein [Gammaproteobacteria bacterium]
MKKTITVFLTQAGVIRNILYFFAIFAIIFKPENSSSLNLEGLHFIPTLVLPVIAPLLVTGFFLDILMSRIYSSEQSEEIKIRFKNIIRVDLFFALLLLALWVPYMIAM